MLNQYAYIDESNIKPNNVANISTPLYSIPNKKRNRNDKEEVVLPDDYSLAGPCILPPKPNTDGPPDTKTLETDKEPSIDNPIKAVGLENATSNTEENGSGQPEREHVEDDIPRFVDNSVYSGSEPEVDVLAYDNRGSLVEETIFEENDAYSE